MSPDAADAGLTPLLEYLRDARGFDFTGYKHASLQRRIAKRLQAVSVESYEAYADYLEVHPDEFSVLFDTILVNVTSFFRDPTAWEFLRGEVIPTVLGRKRPTDPVRVWSAACASGEEAYSLAILLAEAVGAQDLRRRVKIYATD